jgi:hypothetical protein
LKIEIERFSDFAQVTCIANDGTKFTWFMDKFILPSDPRIQKLKSRLVHRPYAEVAV